jgi:hypothetical protein
MGNKGVLTKILAVIGTVLVWIPILAPILLTIAELIRTGMFRLDYLMPAELFPLALVGGGLLLWAALRRRRFRGMIGAGLGGADEAKNTDKDILCSSFQENPHPFP